MTYEFWLGVMASVPAGIVSGLLVSPIKRIWESLGKKAGEARTEWTRKQYREILFYVGNPHRFTQFLNYSSIRTLVGFITFALTNCGSAAVSYLISKEPQFHLHDLPFHWRILVLAGVLAVYLLNLAASLLMSAVSATFVLYMRVRDFSKYFESVPAEIRDLAAKREAITLNGVWTPNT